MEITFDLLDSAEECLEYCLGTDGCNWWTYDSADDICNLTEDCLTQGACETCTLGSKDCQPEVGESSGPIILAGGLNPSYSDHAEVVDLTEGDQVCPYSGGITCRRFSILSRRMDKKDKLTQRKLKGNE